MRFFRSTTRDTTPLDLFDVARTLVDRPADGAPRWIRAAHSSDAWQNVARVLAIPSVAIFATVAVFAFTALPFFQQAGGFAAGAIALCGVSCFFVFSIGDSRTIAFFQKLATISTPIVMLLASLSFLFLLGSIITLSEAPERASKLAPYMYASLCLAASVVALCLLLLATSPTRLWLRRPSARLGSEAILLGLVVAVCLAAVWLACSMFVSGSSGSGATANSLSVASVVLIVAIPAIGGAVALLRRRRLADEALGSAYLEAANVLNTWRCPRRGETDTANVVMAKITCLQARTDPFRALLSSPLASSAVPDSIRLLHDLTDARRRGIADSPEIQAYKSVYDSHFRCVDVHEVMIAYGRCCDEFSRQLLGRRPSGFLKGS